MNNKSIHIAPMMGWTNRHGRFFMRLLSKRVRLWSEMITAGALIYGPREKLCASEKHPSEKYHDENQHIVLQIAGCDSALLAQAARIGQEAGFAEINLNMGCPSSRVGKGGFGAAMMRNLDQAAKSVERMVKAVSIPVSVKCRIAVDQQNPEQILPALLKRFSSIGVCAFAIHARPAWLQGLSPKQNRSVPPLNYDIVYQMKNAFPDLYLTINGGIQTLDEVEQHLQRVDGAMIGRAAFRDPFMLTQIDQRFFGASSTAPSRLDVLAAFADYALRQKLSPAYLIRFASRLWAAQKGAAHFRRQLNQIAVLTPHTVSSLLLATQQDAYRLMHVV